MPEKRTCDGCGGEYWWPAGKWQHQGCMGGHVGGEAGLGVRVGVENGLRSVNGVERKVVSVARKRGRPKVYADPKARRREYMRGWRKEKARKAESVS